MNRAFAGTDEGQALIVVAIAMIVLMGALVLTLDWGYGLVARRAMQSEADAAVLAAARILATSYAPSAPHFQKSAEDVWCAAKAAADQNRANQPTDAAETIAVSFAGADGVFASDPPLSTVSDCASIPSGTVVPDDTVYVRIRASVTYSSIFGLPERRRVEDGNGIQAAATARARLTAGATVRSLQPMNVPAPYFAYGTPGVGLSGWRTAPNVAMWPIVIHYTNWRPNDQSPIRLSWSGAGTDDNFFVSLSHWSPREVEDSSHHHQLISESDFSATDNVDHAPHGTTAATNTGPSWCRPDGLWDSNGFADVRLTAQCDVPNWFDYGFRGALSVGTVWTVADLGWNSFLAGRMPPQLTPVATRSSCNVLPAWVIVPSCQPEAALTTGDWVETLPVGSSGVDEREIHDRIISFIEGYGHDTGTGEKAVVVNVFLWDCGERYAGPPGAADAWTPMGDPNDCASSVDLGSVDRVHLLTAVPMTILESDVRMAGPNLHLTATWGGIFGDAGVCARLPVGSAGCGLNPLMNSAFLVPDE